MNPSEKMHARQFVAAMAATGAKAPKALIEAHARAMALSSAIDSIRARPEDIAVAVAAAVEEGHDPADDERVQRAVCATQIANRGVGAEVDAIAFERFRAVCRDQADAVVAAWVKPFNTAYAALVEAHAVLGNVPLTLTDTILAKGGDVARVWVEAQASSQALTAIVNGWVAFAQFSRLADPARQHALLRMAAVDYQTVSTVDPGSTPWDAVCAGIQLELPTFPEYQRRLANVEEGHRLATIAAAPIDRARSHVAGHDIRVA